MSAALQNVSPAPSGYNRARGLFSREPFALKRAVGRLRPPPSARLAIDAVSDYCLGIDGDQLAVLGAVISVRQIAAERGEHPTAIQRGLAWALRRGVLVRRPDPERPGAYRYAVAHPSRWSSIPCEIPAVDAEGFGPVLVLPVGTLAPVEAMEKSGEGVHTGEHTTHARSSRPAIKKDLTSIDRWYLWSSRPGTPGAERVSVIEVVAEYLDERIPGWTAVLRGEVEAIPAPLVGDIRDYLGRYFGASWTRPAIRLAIARAVELAEVLAADRADDARRAAAAEEARAVELAARVLRDGPALALQVQAADPELARILGLCVAALAEGRRDELGIAVAALDSAEQLAALAAAELAELARRQEAAAIRAQEAVDRGALVAEVEAAEQLAEQLAEALGRPELADSSPCDGPGELARRGCDVARWRARMARSELSTPIRAANACLNRREGSPTGIRAMLAFAVGSARDELQKALRYVSSVKDGSPPNIAANLVGAVPGLLGDLALGDPELGGAGHDPSPEAMRAEPVRVEPGAPGGLVNEGPDGAIREGFGANAAPTVHGAPHGPQERAEGLAPGVQRSDRAGSRGTPVGQAHEARSAFLVGLAPRDREDPPGRVWLQVIPGHRGELGSAEPPGKPDEQQRPIPARARTVARWKAGEQLADQERPSLFRRVSAQPRGPAQQRPDGWIRAGGAVPLRLVEGADSGGVDGERRGAKPGRARGQVQDDIGRFRR